jgi:glycerol-3-phosphate acyltransferase PlsX
MFFGSLMKHKIFKRSLLSKIGYLFCKKGVDDVMKTMDSREIGGTQFLGIKKPVIKCHGNSDRLAFRNGIGQAIQAAQGNFDQELEEALAQLKNLEGAAE